MSTQRQVEQDQKQSAIGAPKPMGFFQVKKAFGQDVVVGDVSELVDRLQRCSRDQGSAAPRSRQNRIQADGLVSSRSKADGRTAWLSFLAKGVRDATNSLNSGSRCQWRFRHGSGFSPQQLPLISPLLSSASMWNRQAATLHEAQPVVFQMQSALPQVPTGGLPGDGKATWPRKFVSPARRMKRGLPFWKTINSPRFITSGKMSTPSPVRFTKAV